MIALSYELSSLWRNFSGSFLIKWIREKEVNQADYHYDKRKYGNNGNERDKSCTNLFAAAYALVGVAFTLR